MGILLCMLHLQIAMAVPYGWTAGHLNDLGEMHERELPGANALHSDNPFSWGKNRHHGGETSLSAMEDASRALDRHVHSHVGDEGDLFGPTGRAKDKVMRDRLDDAAATAAIAGNAQMSRSLEKMAEDGDMGAVSALAGLRELGGDQDRLSAAAAAGDGEALHDLERMAVRGDAGAAAALDAMSGGSIGQEIAASSGRSKGLAAGSGRGHGHGGGYGHGRGHGRGGGYGHGGHGHGRGHRHGAHGHGRGHRHRHGRGHGRGSYGYGGSGHGHGGGHDHGHGHVHGGHRWSTVSGGEVHGGGHRWSTSSGGEANGGGMEATGYSAESSLGGGGGSTNTHPVSPVTEALDSMTRDAIAQQEGLAALAGEETGAEKALGYKSAQNRPGEDAPGQTTRPDVEAAALAMGASASQARSAAQSAALYDPLTPAEKAAARVLASAEEEAADSLMDDLAAEIAAGAGTGRMAGAGSGGLAGAGAGETAGEIAGGMAGADAGETAGEIAGGIAGGMAGPGSGEIGAAAGKMAGAAAGRMAGAGAGGLAGAGAGGIAGAGAGETAGAGAGGMAGAGAGGMAGEIAGADAGSMAGETAGEVAGAAVAQRLAEEEAAAGQEEAEMEEAPIERAKALGKMSEAYKEAAYAEAAGSRAQDPSQAREMAAKEEGLLGGEDTEGDLGIIGTIPDDAKSVEVQNGHMDLPLKTFSNEKPKNEGELAAKKRQGRMADRLRNTVTRDNIQSPLNTVKGGDGTFFNIPESAQKLKIDDGTVYYPESAKAEMEKEGLDTTALKHRYNLGERKNKPIGEGYYAADASGKEMDLPSPTLKSPPKVLTGSDGLLDIGKADALDIAKGRIEMIPWEEYNKQMHSEVNFPSKLPVIPAAVEKALRNAEKDAEALAMTKKEVITNPSGKQYVRITPPIGVPEQVDMEDVVKSAEEGGIVSGKGSGQDRAGYFDAEESAGEMRSRSLNIEEHASATSQNTSEDAYGRKELSNAQMESETRDIPSKTNSFNKQSSASKESILNKAARRQSEKKRSLDCRDPANEAKVLAGVIDENSDAFSSAMQMPEEEFLSAYSSIPEKTIRVFLRYGKDNKKPEYQREYIGAYGDLKTIYGQKAEMMLKILSGAIKATKDKCMPIRVVSKQVKRVPMRKKILVYPKARNLHKPVKVVQRKKIVLLKPTVVEKNVLTPVMQVKVQKGGSGEKPS